MRAVIQRVIDAWVEVDGQILGSADNGLLVYLGVGKDDAEEDAAWIADKVAHLRIFEDAAGKMNRSVLEDGGSILVISQFTLYADARKGRRPSYSGAAEPDLARKLYESFGAKLREYGLRVAEGRFQSEMAVKSTNMGPVTIILDSKKAF